RRPRVAQGGPEPSGPRQRPKERERHVGPEARPPGDGGGGSEHVVEKPADAQCSTKEERIDERAAQPDDISGEPGSHDQRKHPPPAQGGGGGRPAAPPPLATPGPPPRSTPGAPSR